MASKLLNVRLSDGEMRRLERQAKVRALSKSALIRRWISERDVPTAADAAQWEKRNDGNKGLRIRL